MATLATETRFVLLYQTRNPVQWVRAYEATDEAEVRAVYINKSNEFKGLWIWKLVREDTTELSLDEGGRTSS